MKRIQIFELGQVAVFTIGLILFIVPSLAHACRPGPDADIRKSVEENFRNKNFVFLGKLVSTTSKASKGGVFEIIRVLKGDIEGETLTYQTASHSCGFFHKEGVVMILFLDKVSDGTISLSALTPYQRFDTIAEGLAAAKKLELSMK